jgi:colanic acid/amylovoran biosynthesis glycosyltransferase
VPVDIHPPVVVFCDHLLYPSETFIRAQAQALRRFAPVYAGSRRVKGLELPEENTFTINQGGLTGRARELAFKFFGSAPGLARRLRDRAPALMHAHFGPDGLYALPLAKKLGIPLIVTFHGSDATATDLRHVKAPYGYRRFLTQKIILQREANLFLAVSEFIRKKLEEQGFPSEKVIVHHIGVDTALFSPGGRDKESIVLFVGRLVERKGVDYLIRAMAEVQKITPNAELVLIGDGHLREELENQASQTLRRCRFLGTQSPEVVREWMDRASVFCAPSVRTISGEEEGFGMVFAEAQAIGTPVVSFASGGISEAVQHGETGFLAAECDWHGLAKYLSVLLENDDLCSKFGAAGRERVLRHFDLNTQTAALETIYDSVLETATVADRAPASLLAQQEN